MWDGTPSTMVTFALFIQIASQTFTVDLSHHHHNDVIHTPRHIEPFILLLPEWKEKDVNERTESITDIGIYAATTTSSPTQQTKTNAHEVG
ncbi:hypothetical protein BLOT_010713 [Blomia tropicalis]|nr:hypothetical protein BLOT_010713 [Blomia tropicalis]